MRRGGQRRCDVTDLLKHLGGDVAGDIVVDEVRRPGGDFRRDHHRQRLVLDLHRIGRVLGDVAAVRHDESHGLACVSHDF